MEIEIGGTEAVTDYDVLELLGDATFDGLVVLKFFGEFAPQQGDQFEFLRVAGEVDLTRATFEVENLLPGFDFDIVPTPDGLQMVAMSDGVFVPEPSSILLSVFSLVAMTGILWRRA